MQLTMCRTSACRIEDLSSLSKLAELNLRRNLLTSLCAMDEDTDERNCVEREHKPTRSLASESGWQVFLFTGSIGHGARGRRQGEGGWVAGK